MDSELCCVHGFVPFFLLLFYGTVNIINEILFDSECPWPEQLSFY